MDNLDILGVGNALVDETFYIEEDLVRKTNLNFNQFKQISYSEQQEIKSLLGNQVPEIVCGGSTTNSLVAASNFFWYSLLDCPLTEIVKTIMHMR